MKAEWPGMEPKKSNATTPHHQATGLHLICSHREAQDMGKKCFCAVHPHNAADEILNTRRHTWQHITHAHMAWGSLVAETNRSHNKLALRCTESNTINTYKKHSDCTVSSSDNVLQQSKQRHTSTGKNLSLHSMMWSNGHSGKALYQLASSLLSCV